ncbi:MAG: hypothetical protein IKT41_01415 [Clostridia bacterium]|nr:hypothetical protein [Clostridia bacterium]
MKKLMIILTLILLLIILAYVTNITSIPDSITIFKGETLVVGNILGTTIESKDEAQVLKTSSNNESNLIGTTKVSLKLFNSINLKDITVNVIPETKVVALGNLVGLKLYTNGVLVVGMSEIKGHDNNKYKPYENTGIKEGDRIVAVSDNSITCTDDLIEQVNLCNGESIKLEYVQDGELKQTSVIPTKTSDNSYKLGLWVRDTAAGVGTLSFYEPSTGYFAALGHGIYDIDTEKIVEISNGEFVTTSIVNIIKGEEGKAGKIQGTIENGIDIGTVYKNTEFGVYGKLDNISALNINKNNTLEIASRGEIKEGPAAIRCTLENDEVKEYSIEIQKIYSFNNNDNKSMLIKVTDEELIEKTGGIIQRNEWKPNCAKRKVYRSSNPCTSIGSN